MLITAAPLGAAAADTLTVDVAISLDVVGATAVDLNVRLNPDYVSGAKIVSISDSFSDASIADNVDGAKYKLAIALPEAADNAGELCRVRLTLKKQASDTTELIKIMQVKVNEKITFQADNAVLIDGIKDGGIYTEPVTIRFNEGSAMLNGNPFTNGATVEAVGEYVLKITDANGKTRTVNFSISTSVITGDMDCNGGVDSNDAIYLLRHTLDSARYPISQSGDVDGNGSVNSNDAIYLLRHTLDHDRYPLR